MINTKNGYGLLVIAGLVLSTLALLFLFQEEESIAPSKPQASPEIAHAGEAPTEQPEPDIAPPASVEPEETEHFTPEVEVSSEREAIDTTTGTGVLRGQVITETGSAIAGSQVSWTAWDPDYLPYVLAAVEIPVEELRARTVQALTDENGYYFFDEAPATPSDESSFVWVSHPDHLAEVIELAAETFPQEEAQKFVLRAAPTITVSVTNGEGPAVGALIVQQTAYPRGTNAPFEGGKHAPQASLVFFRVYSADSSGQARVAPLQLKHRIHAEEGTLLSAPWIGLDQKIVPLSLIPTFEFSGYVEFPEDYDDISGLPQIRISRQRAGLRNEISTIPVAEDGTIAPVLVPVLSADSYKFVIDGAEFLPDEHVTAPPKRDEKILIDFEGKSGRTIWYLPLNPDEQPILDAEVHAHWFDEDGRRIEKVGTARLDGYVRLVGVPDGALNSRISAPGYGVVTFDPILVPENPPIVHEVPMVPAHQVRGRCLVDGMPLSDFEVRYWPPSDPFSRSRLSVTDSTTGEFVIDDCPSTKIALEAISIAFERSEVIIVDLESSPDDEILLEVNAPASMSGTVVDARTLEPIAGVTIEVYSTMGNAEMDPIGEPATVGPGGQFNVKRLNRSNNVVSFSAPGYSTRELKVTGKNGDVDLGLIELSGQQALTARLLLPEGQDPQEYLLTARGVGAIPATQFDANGEISIENANEGAYTFEVADKYGTGDILLSHWRWMRLGEEWHFEFDRVGGRQLLVRTSNPGDDAELDEYWATISYPSITGNQESIWRRLSKAGEVNVAGGIGTGPLSIRIVHGTKSNMPSGAKVTLVSDESPAQILIDLQLGDNRAEVLVIDPDGNPLPGVQITLRASNQSALGISGATTNSLGRASFLAVSENTDYATLTNPNGGINDRVPFIHPKTPGDVVELVFDMRASIRLHLHDGGVPQSTVVCRLWSGEYGYTISTGRTANDAGNVVLDELGPGTYELQTDGPQHWPVIMDVEATAAGSQYNVEVRRTADLDLKLIRQSGAPAANQAVELRHAALGDTVSQWLSSGKLPISAGATSTDNVGMLRLRGVPHGEYIWSCADGGASLTLKPGEPNEAQGVLP